MSALAIAKAIFPDETAPHFKAIRDLARSGVNFDYGHQVNSVVHILGFVEEDMRHRLFRSIEDAAVALSLARASVVFRSLVLKGLIAWQRRQRPV